jgi:hypothetical protein
MRKTHRAEGFFAKQEGEVATATASAGGAIDRLTLKSKKLI